MSILRCTLSNHQCIHANKKIRYLLYLFCSHRHRATLGTGPLFMLSSAIHATESERTVSKGSGWVAIKGIGNGIYNAIEKPRVLWGVACLV